MLERTLGQTRVRTSGRTVPVSTETGVVGLGEPSGMSGVVSGSSVELVSEETVVLLVEVSMGVYFEKDVGPFPAEPVFRHDDRWYSPVDP